MSQAGSSYRYKQPLKSIGGLSSDKLANFDRISQPRDTLSKIPSQVGSIAPSQAPTKSIVSRLEKIEEVPEGTPVQKSKFDDIKTQYLGEISKWSFLCNPFLLGAYLKELQLKDKDVFDLLIQITKFVQNS